MNKRETLPINWVLNRPPRPVQIAAALKAAGHDRYGYWLEQRLGKTPLTLNEFVNNDDWDIMLVVVPNSYKMGWSMAPAEWGVGLWSGFWPRHKLPDNSVDKGLFSINYESARSPAINRQLTKLVETRRCLLVIDESSCIKSPSSDNSRTLIELSKRAAGVRELNGTPITQNVLDFFAQLKCLGQLNGVDSTNFKHRYAKLGGYMGKKVVGIEREHELYNIIDRCAFRALRKDWDPGHKEPELIPMRLEMTPRQQRHYREMMEEFMTIVADLEVEASMVLTQMDKLRQLSSCVAIAHGHYERIEQPAHNPKVKAVLDIHASGPGKTVIVHFYTPSGEVLMEALTKAGLKPAQIRGSMKPEDLVEQKAYFNQDPDCRALVVQQTAGCMGHDLSGNPGDRCDRIIMYEQSFNLRDRLQMLDRPYYSGQTLGVYDLVCSPMEAVVINTLATKKSTADAIDEIVATVRSGAWQT